MYLPNELTTPLINNDNCEDYYINLDTLDKDISNDMLFTLEPSAYRKVPFKIWNGTLQFGPLYNRTPITSVISSVTSPVRISPVIRISPVTPQSQKMRQNMFVPITGGVQKFKFNNML
jgi:hypothetical protein